MGHFKIDDEFWVFEIQTGFGCDSHHCVTYGDFSTCIEVRVDNFTGNIYDIQCIYMGNVLSETIFQLPDIRSNPELNKLSAPKCLEEDDCSRIPCLINVTRDEMAVIINPSSFDVAYCYIDDRVEFYYNENLELLHIKVVDLTEEEFTFLKSRGATGKHFHWIGE